MGSRARTTKTGKVKGDLTRETHVPSSNLDSSGQGRPERRKKSRGESKGEKRVPNPGPTSMVVSWVGRCKARANFNGGELDFEHATGTHKGSH